MSVGPRYGVSSAGGGAFFFSAFLGFAVRDSVGPSALCFALLLEAFSVVSDEGGSFEAVTPLRLPISEAVGPREVADSDAAGGGDGDFASAAFAPLLLPMSDSVGPRALSFCFS